MFSTKKTFKENVKSSIILCEHGAEEVEIGIVDNRSSSRITVFKRPLTKTANVDTTSIVKLNL